MTGVVDDSGAAMLQVAFERSLRALNEEKKDWTSSPPLATDITRETKIVRLIDPRVGF